MRENVIHPTAIIGKGVTMGEANIIGPYCVISGETTIGNGNRFRAFCVIGTPAEHKDYLSKPWGNVTIGDGNHFSEHVTVHAGTNYGTKIGNNCLFLTKAQIGHDCEIFDDVTISCLSVVGGHAVVMQGANLGLGTMVHQWQVIGAYSMLGMNSTVTKKSRILPGKIYAGSPAKLIKVNLIGLTRANVETEKLSDFIELQRILLKRNGLL